MDVYLHDGTAGRSRKAEAFSQATIANRAVEDNFFTRRGSREVDATLAMFLAERDKGGADLGTIFAELNELELSLSFCGPAFAFSFGSQVDPAALPAKPNPRKWTELYPSVPVERFYLNADSAQLDVADEVAIFTFDLPCPCDPTELTP